MSYREVESDSIEDESPYSSEPDESGTVQEASCRARGKHTIPAHDVLNHLFTFDTGSVKTVKKRSRSTSDSADKGHPSKQARSGPATKQPASNQGQLTTPSRAPQPIPRNPLGSTASSVSPDTPKEHGERVIQNGPTPTGSRQQQQDLGIASALGELTNTMKKVVKQLEKQEARLDSVEKKLSSPSVSSSSSSGERKKPKVSLVVRAEVRRVYRALLEQDENFNGFNTEKGSTFKDATNVRIVQKLIKEVSGANPSFGAGNIRSASYSHYRSLCQEESLKRRGKHAERNVVRRRRERINRKLQNRLAALERSTINEHQKSKLMAVLALDFMSSEESNDDSDDELEDTYIVRELPWRSSKVDEVFIQLDEETKRSMSKQSKRQQKKRIYSEEPSSRPKPSGKFPSWAFVTPAAAATK